MVRIIYSESVLFCFRNPLILPSTSSIEGFLDARDLPVAIWEFDRFWEAVKFVRKHYHKWKYARGWEDTYVD